MRQIIEADFLELSAEHWHSQIQDDGKNRLILSNLPYSASIAILNRLTTWRDSISEMILMFQDEVSQRIAFELGHRSTGSLTVWTQNFWNIEYLYKVKPQAFRPPPKVDSSVVHFQKRDYPIISNTNEKSALFEDLLKVSFKHPRKMIRSNLKQLQNEAAIFDQCEVDPTLRPQHLTWQDWQSLWDAFLKIRNVTAQA